MENKNNNTLTSAILFFIAAICFYITFMLNKQIVFLCLGSAFVCIGIAYTLKNNKKDK